MELNASEPLMKCRKRKDDVKTEGVSLPWDRFGSDRMAFSGFRDEGPDAVDIEMTVAGHIAAPSARFTRGMTSLQSSSTAPSV